MRIKENLIALRVLDEHSYPGCDKNQYGNPHTARRLRCHYFFAILISDTSEDKNILLR